AGILQKRFNASVLVDNDVNIMALGEHRTAWPAVTDMLFVKVATGIGSGIIADGELRRGAQGAAGDIGHVAVPSAADVPCRCGNVGCLEAVASGQAVAAALAAAGLDASNSADVVALVRTGDLAASQAVRQAGRDIGSVLAACVSLLNPSLIVIGGIVAEAGEHLIAGIREIVYQRSLPLATQHLRIVTSQARGQAGVLGASAMAVDHVLSPAAIDALIAWAAGGRARGDAARGRGRAGCAEARGGVMTGRDRRALVVRGGWPGHAPEEAAELFVPFLEASGFDVTLEGSLEAYADQEFMAGIDL